MITKSLVTRMADRFGVEPEKFMATIKATAFKKPKDGPEISNEQMMALLVVAEQYSLNPWTREIYAFADKQQGIVPVVGVDGWSRICNEHPQFDGLQFKYAEDVDAQRKDCPRWCEAIIRRKDRTHPVVVREYLDECYRNTSPWGSHPKRMLRHKALIQCARVAFGFAGIYDKDEAKDIVHGDAHVVSDGADRLNKLLTIAPADVTNGHNFVEAQDAYEAESPKPNDTAD